PPGMSPELADEFMAGLKAGKTLRMLTSGDKKCGPAMVTPRRFKKHCELNPEWGAEAERLAKKNQHAAYLVTTTIDFALARQRSAESRRNSETCANGHVRTLHNTFYIRNERNCLVRRCKD